jgi:predicted metal-dependent phosphoesterase TrpH
VAFPGHAGRAIRSLAGARSLASVPEPNRVAGWVVAFPTDRGVGGTVSGEFLERHPHLAVGPEPGWVRVDCHSHTMWSGDSSTTPDELAEAVAGAGIDVLCITDHHAVAGAERLAAELGCRVVVGEEVRTTRGELIGLFLSERIPYGMSPHETARRIRAQGGIVYVPHPLDPMRRALSTDALEELIGDGLVDAIEAFNAKTRLAHLNASAAELARRHGLAPGAGSDAHVAEALGAAYVELPDRDLDQPGGFLAALREGRIVGHHADPVRPWRPRVVPSTSPSP